MFGCCCFILFIHTFFVETEYFTHESAKTVYEYLFPQFVRWLSQVWNHPKREAKENYYKLENDGFQFCWRLFPNLNCTHGNQFLKTQFVSLEISRLWNCYTFNWLEKNVCIYNGFEANLVLDDSRSLDSRFDQGLQVPPRWDNI